MSALVKPVSQPLTVDSGLQVSVEEEQGIQPCLPGCKEHLWFQPPIHSIQFSQFPSCPTQSSLATLKPPKGALGGWAVFATLGEETDVQRVC